MDRNIITKSDAINIRKRIREINEPDSRTPGRTDQEAPLGGGSGNTDQETPLGGGSGADVKPDAWFQRLAKYIPAEALGLYFTLAGLVGVDDLQGNRGIMILVTVVMVCIVFNTLYLRRLWKVSRWGQISISGAALLAYAFASGGALIQQLPFYEPRIGTFVVVLASAFMAFIDPPSPAP
jgi:hypothetical protein